jgi:hypothetical protein
VAINGTQRRSPGFGGCTHFSLSCMQSRAIKDNQGHLRALEWQSRAIEGTQGNQGQSRRGCTYVLLSCMRYIIIQLFERE